jgi:glycerol-3-phosphate dehydrogenase
MVTRLREGPRRTYDVAVVGGGINGSAIARDAAMRGFRTLLVEQDDLSSGTSAWSSRMIHGGIKYLENGEIDLVRESLREREWLLRAAPHLVRPLPFLMPFLKRNRRGPLLLRLGMIAYDVLSIDKSLPRHRILGRSEVRALVPGIEEGQLSGGALFYDAQVDYAERLSVENARSANDHGAEVLTHARVERLRLEGGRVRGVDYCDQLTGESGTAWASLVVNATGPWADGLLAGLPDHTSPMIGGTKGSHLVVDPFPGAPSVAMYYEAMADGRPVLVIPWLGRYLIGSTDIRYHGDPADARADDREIEYILSETNRLLPSANLSRGSIRFVYTGVRPLPFEPDDDVSKITRHHVIHDHSPAVEGLVTIIGGKLTTFRSLGQEAVDMVAKKLPSTRRKCTTRSEPLPGGRTANFASFSAGFVDNANTGELVARRLLALYGARASDVLAIAQSDPALARIFNEHHGAIAAEIEHAVRHEFARTLTDVLMRRTMLGLDPELGPESVEAAAEIMARCCGWDRERTSNEVDSYIAYARRFRPSEPTRDGAHASLVELRD